MIPVLLLAIFLRHYVYALAPTQHAADVWNIAGAFVVAGLLVTVLRHQRGLALFAGAWWLAEELFVIGCSAAFIVRPWPRAEGEAQCSALLGYDLGLVGLLVLAVLALLWARAHPVRPNR